MTRHSERASEQTIGRPVTRLAKTQKTSCPIPFSGSRNCLLAALAPTFSPCRDPVSGSIFRPTLAPTSPTFRDSHDPSPASLFEPNFRVSDHLGPCCPVPATGRFCFKNGWPSEANDTERLRPLFYFCSIIFFSYAISYADWVLLGSF